MTGLRKFFRDNSLSITLFVLFVLGFAGQAVSGVLAINSQRAQHGLSSLSIWSVFQTGTFLNGMFVNWQAAILQLGSLIFLSAFLVQQGAAHSKKPPNERKGRSRIVRQQRNRGGRNGRGRSRKGKDKESWLYRNSLFLGFVVLFTASFVLHWIFGRIQYNEQQAVQHLPTLSLGGYLGSSTFWFSNFQTWEAEYFAIGLYIVLSIFLRQEGSAESKPPDSSDKATGEHNE